MELKPPKWILWSLVLLACIVGGKIFVWRVMDMPIGASDFHAYWAASRLFMEGRNPCNPDNMLEMEQTHFNPNQDSVMMTWNPPTMWVFMLPLAWMPFQVAQRVWLLVNVVLLLVSCLLLGLTYLPREHTPLLIYCLAALFFPPILSVIQIGQITFLVLIGVALALFLIKHERWFWAGAALILTSVKPHLMLLMGPYLMFYMAARRKWSGWLGLGVAGMTCLAILFILRPAWVVDFSALLDMPPVDWATPTIGGFLSLYGVGPWSRYIGVSLLLLLPFFLRRSETISVETATSILILVTIPTTFFGWSFDQSLLLPPTAQIVGWLFGPLRSTVGRWVLSAAMIVVIIANIAQRVTNTYDVYFLQMSLAWCAIYALASWMVGRVKRTAPALAQADR